MRTEFSYKRGSECSGVAAEHGIIHHFSPYLGGTLCHSIINIKLIYEGGWSKMVNHLQMSRQI